jgi:hypothetical protein
MSDRSENWDTEMALRLEGSELQWPIMAGVTIDGGNADAEYYVELETGDEGNPVALVVLGEGSHDFAEDLNDDERENADEFLGDLEFSDAWEECNVELPKTLLQVDKSTFTITRGELLDLAKEQGVELGLALAGRKRKGAAKEVVNHLLGDESP